MNDTLLPWLVDPVRRAQHGLRAHAVLVHGPRGVGQFEFALALASSWLCESDAEPRPCGRCAACRLIAARTHPDLMVLLPDALREALGWAADDDPAPREGKAKPSKDIRVEDVRRAIAFAQTTSARGRAKVLVLHPAERMNAVAANALLKSLEEPPGVVRFVLASAAIDRLLPTIRSRCQAVALVPPESGVALAWLAEQGLAEAEVVLQGSGGQPQDALDAAATGIDAALWRRLPALVARGDAAPLAAWPLPRLVESLQKLCHDAMCVRVGAPPRYFPAASLERGQGGTDRLVAWWRALGAVALFDEHPWNAALLAEALVDQGRRALAPLNSASR